MIEMATASQTAKICFPTIPRSRKTAMEMEWVTTLTTILMIPREPKEARARQVKEKKLRTQTAMAFQTARTCFLTTLASGKTATETELETTQMRSQAIQIA